jgi:hypothetical protein
MKRFRTALALLLALIWVPVTMHCALEGVPGLEFLICCEHEDAAPHQDDDCEADACAVVESGFYKLQDDEVLVVACSELDVFDYELKDETAVLTASRPPPDLTVGWQFSSRAALLPRAPSYLL